MTNKEKLEKAVQFCINLSYDDSHGYSNVVDDNLGQHGDYDCGGFISAGLKHAGIINGVFEPNEEYGNSWSWGTVLYPAGFKKLPFVSSDVRRGDILIKNGRHTELAIGNGQQVGAHDNYDGVRGDYGHRGEISIVPLSNGYWDFILRLDDTEPSPEPTPTPTPEPTGKEPEYRTYDDVKKCWLPIVKGGSDYAGIFGHDVDCVAIKGAEYCVHCWGGDEAEHYGFNGWLPVVNGYDLTDYSNGFAGNHHPIDALAIKSDKEFIYQVHYRKSGKWEEPVSSKNFNLNDSENGYAGTIGQPVDGIRIWKK